MRGKISCADLFSEAKDMRSAKSLKDNEKEWLIKPMTKERGLGLHEYLAVLHIAADLKSIGGGYMVSRHHAHEHR